MPTTLTIIEGPNYSRDENGWEHNAYTVRLKRSGRSMTTPWRQGLGITEDPSAEDVLECLMLDAIGYDNAEDFSDWASQYGYDEDSPKAFRLYNQVGILAQRLRRFLGDDWDATSTEDVEDAAKRLVAS